MLLVITVGSGGVRSEYSFEIPDEYYAQDWIEKIAEVLKETPVFDELMVNTVA